MRGTRPRPAAGRRRARAAARAAAATVAICLGPAAGGAGAAVIPVDTTVDQYGDGLECSLREAVQAANTDAAFGGCPPGSAADTVELPEGREYFLTRSHSTPDTNSGGDLDVAAPLILTPAGPAGATVSSGGADRVLHVLRSGAASLVGVEVRSGQTPSRGGGILVSGFLGASGATVANSSSGADGGGIAVVPGGRIELLNATISGNRAAGGGGGLDVEEGGSAYLRSSTVSANIADLAGGDAGRGGGVFAAGSVTLANTLIAGNSDAGEVEEGAPECAGALRSEGHSLIASVANCSVVTGPGDRLGVNPILAPLDEFGGPVETHALPGPSLAVNRGSPAPIGSASSACPSRDARGVPRPQGPRCDIGAYEHVTCAGLLVNRVGTATADDLVGEPGTESFMLLEGADEARGATGTDGACGGRGADRLIGGGGRDRLLGENGPDRISGQSGDDLLEGGSAGDRVSGGRGLDLLIGGPGRDRLDGGGGGDRCLGGPGRDVEKSC